MREGNFVRKFIAVFGFVLMFVLLIGVEAKADLVDDIIKKNNLDPKNNHWDQCWLMNEVYLKILTSSSNKANERISCIQNICKKTIPTYHFYKDGKWHSSDATTIIYQNNKIIGRILDLENLYSEKNLNSYMQDNENGYLIDIRNHPNFKNITLAKKEKCDSRGCVFANTNDSNLKLTKFSSLPNSDTSYIKINGCHIEDTNIENLIK